MQRNYFYLWNIFTPSPICFTRPKNVSTIHKMGHLLKNLVPLWKYFSHKAYHLLLLPSGPDKIHGALLKNILHTGTSFSYIFCIIYYFFQFSKSILIILIIYFILVSMSFKYNFVKICYFNMCFFFSNNTINRQI